MNDRFAKPCSSTSLGSDEVEDNYCDEDETTKFEFEQFKQWLDAGSPASKIPRADEPATSKQPPVEPAPIPSAPAPADVMCSKCRRKECNLTCSYNFLDCFFS